MTVITLRASFYYLISSSQQPCEVSTSTVPTLQMRGKYLLQISQLVRVELRFELRQSGLST